MPVTVPTSKQVRDRLAWHAARNDTLLLLRQKFPQAFTRLSNRNRRPLKIGIHADIAAVLPELGPAELSLALRHYVGDLRYQRACSIEGTARVDLDGNPAGIVTAAEAEHSKRSVAGIEAKLAQRRASARANPAPAINTPAPRFSLADLKAAAAKRKANGGSAS